MSTVFVDTIKNQAGTTSLAADKLPDMLSGSAKAWANLNGSSFGLRDDFNISTAVDNGTGNYTLNFSNAFANTNYSAVVTSDDSGSSRAFAQSKTYATSSFVATMKRGDTGATVDKDIVIAAVHGDLA